MNNWLSQWYSKHLYVDIDTGQQIDKKDIANYTIIKIRKHAKRSKYGTGGIREFINECRKNKYSQQRLFDTT